LLLNAQHFAKPKKHPASAVVTHAASVNQTQIPTDAEAPETALIRARAM
jgi:hypothetical protein